MSFVDRQKVFDRVSRKVMERAVIKKGIRSNGWRSYEIVR